MLQWNEPALIAFFGVVPSFHEDALSHSFDIRREGMQLLVTLFDFEGAVYVSMFREGWVDPLFTVRRECCTHAHIRDDSFSLRCFEAGSPKHSVTTMGIPPVLARGVRVFVEPHFRVELIEDPFDI